MSANDSGIENSNDSNDFTLTFPAAFKDFKDFTSPTELNAYSSTSSQQPHSMVSQLRQQSMNAQSSTGKMKMSKHSIKLASLPYFRTRLSERKLRVAASISNVELLTKYLETGINPNGMISFLLIKVTYTLVEFIPDRKFRTTLLVLMFW